MSVQVKIYGQQVLTFADDAVVKVRLRQKVDLTGGGLPEVDLEVLLHSEAPLRLQNEQKLELYRFGGLQATVYAGECTRLGEKLYRVRGRRQLEYLQTEYLGGIYEEVSPYTLLDQLLEGRDYELAVPLSDGNVTGYLPRCSRQEAVRQLAVSMGAVVCAKREGTLWLRTPEYEDTQVLEPGRILGENSLQMLPEYTRFELAAHSYTQGQFPVKLRDQVEYPAGLTTIYVSSPHYNYYTEDAYSNYVEEEGPNYVVVSQHGRMTLYAYPYIKEYAEQVMKQYPGRMIHVYPIENRFFGKMITVAGLITGQDLLEQLKGKSLGSRLLLPEAMFRSGEEVFLDDISRTEVQNALQVRVDIVKSSGYDFVEALLHPVEETVPKHGEYELETL